MPHHAVNDQRHEATAWRARGCAQAKPVVAPDGRRVHCAPRLARLGVRAPHRREPEVDDQRQRAGGGRSFSAGSARRAGDRGPDPRGGDSARRRAAGQPEGGAGRASLSGRPRSGARRPGNSPHWGLLVASWGIGRSLP